VDGVAPLTADAFATALFAASSKVRTATGAPANIVGVSPGLFQTLGGLPTLRNPAYGVQNAAGTAAANTLTINVNGMNVEEWPYLPETTMVVSNSAAAKFPEYGPQVATAEDVRKLGQDVAVWGMYEDAEVYYPAGVRAYVTVVGGADAGGEPPTTASRAKVTTA
jgi:hypothetical protein